MQMVPAVCSTGEADNIFAPPLTSTPRQQPNQARGHGEVQKAPARCSLEEDDEFFDPPLASTPRQQPSQDSTQFKVPKSGDTSFEISSTNISQDLERLPARCDSCGFIGNFANHLRKSQRCLKAYREYPEFDMVGGNDEDFIVRACVLAKKCPCPSCPGGSHWNEIPSQCLAWWTTCGWKIMAWKGVTESSNSADIKKKMYNYRAKRRKTQDRSQTHEEKVVSNTNLGKSARGENQLKEHGVTGESECGKCGSRGPLAAHLFKSEVCLQAMSREHLSRTEGLNPRRLLMDLSLLLQFCPNPGCTTTTVGDGPIPHLEGSCGQHIVSEAVAVYNWGEDCDRTRIGGKLKRRARHLTVVSRQAQLLGTKGYEWELSNLLKITCSRCFIQGQELDMVECIASLPPMWQCQKCWESQGDGEDIWGQVLAEQQRLADSRHNDVMKAVKIQDGENDRIVFLPPSLAPDLPPEEDHPLLDPKKTTVLVPQHPDALDIFNEETLDDALKENKSLKKTTEFLSKRIFFSPALEQTLTVMLRKKLAEIKEGRLRMLSGMKSAHKGIVVSRKPNEAKIKERNPHYDATKPSSLTNSCPWSVGHLHQKEDESRAISCANGQLRTRTRLRILKNLAEGSPELAQIMMLVSKQHFNGQIFPLISTAPIVLQFVKAKIDLLIKHAISQQYTNWDLQVDFKKEGWSVDLMGLLYSTEYNEINEQIANEGIGSMSDIVGAVLRGSQVRPIASLDKQWIANHCGIREEEAEVRKMYFSD